jgi:hypothetical protein
MNSDWFPTSFATRARRAASSASLAGASKTGAGGVTRIAGAGAALCELTGLTPPPARDSKSSIANKLKLTHLLYITTDLIQTLNFFQNFPAFFLCAFA